MQLPLIAPPVTEPSPSPIHQIGTQGDIRYFDRVAKGVLNPPESTGMPFWSINPYVGCAFGCAYCYARYAHRYVAEREVVAGADPDGALAALPPWLAFERRIFVKRNAADVLRETLRGAGGGQWAGGRHAIPPRPRTTTHAIHDSPFPIPDSRGPVRSPVTSHASRLSRLGRLWRGETIVIGTATDPYQPAERTHRVTAMLETMDREGFGACGNQYECEAVCPKRISVQFIAALNREYIRAGMVESGLPVEPESPHAEST